MRFEPNFCLHCGSALALLTQEEDGGPKQRLRCPACGWTHWNNPTPVLAAIIEMPDRDGQVLLARNAAWPGRMFALITGFMEAGETPEEGIAREVLEETSLKVDSLKLVGVYDFQHLAAAHLRQGLLRLQDRQRAIQAAGVEFSLRVHGIPRMRRF